MTITQIEYALAVFKTKNFSNAAKICHISQPTLSMQLRKLEDFLGYALFDRSKNPIFVTEIGEKFLKQAFITLHEFKKLQEIKISDVPEGDLVIGIIPSISPYLVPLFFKKFMIKYPKIKLHILELKTEEIIDKLGKDEIDGGILATPLRDYSLIERVLFYEPFLGYVSSGHELYKKNKISMAELDASDVWVLDKGHCLRTQVLKLCGHTNKRHQIEFTGGSLETLISLVDQGMGMTILPKLATGHAQPKQLKEFSNEIPTREISLVAMRTFYKEHLLDCLEEIIVDVLPNEYSSPKKSKLKILNPI